MKHILIIEDDISLGNGISIALTNDNIKATLSHNLKDAGLFLSKNTYDLIILDINLPDGNGLSFLKDLRKTNDLKVILLTAKDLEMDIVAGLESGANDYITKPFSLAVLRARVNTQLKKNVMDLKIKIDCFDFDFDNMNFYKNKESVELSKTEQKLLKLLVLHKGVTLKRDTLIDRIWTDGADYVDENALSVTIKRLRNKIEENPSKPVYIKTVYGLGYVWEVN